MNFNTRKGSQTQGRVVPKKRKRKPWKFIFRKMRNKSIMFIIIRFVFHLIDLFFEDN